MVIRMCSKILNDLSKIEAEIQKIKDLSDSYGIEIPNDELLRKMIETKVKS